eukprot:gnl/TRDRNA2_/TRDRNA2_74303_c0_seq1.p1 gnl/TRDRNA2_/TRDRNA2_74303_c0~~gnl/TRDRNA2_/TRDRNA2_74303_c0_seq1.p1  ORF type:complete len:275 (+),score=27.33 gnl/TRDRNA2_/TRDRNA2_74303_c0_seq1:126-950(+)
MSTSSVLVLTVFLLATTVDAESCPPGGSECMNERSPDEVAMLQTKTHTRTRVHLSDEDEHSLLAVGESGKDEESKYMEGSEADPVPANASSTQVVAHVELKAASRQTLSIQNITGKTSVQNMTAKLNITATTGQKKSKKKHAVKSRTGASSRTAFCTALKCMNDCMSTSQVRPTTQSSCIAYGCKWHASESPPSCSPCVGTSENDCEQTSGCGWETSISACLPDEEKTCAQPNVPEQGSSVQDKCSLKENNVTCLAYQVNGQDACEWYPPVTPR